MSCDDGIEFDKLSEWAQEFALSEKLRRLGLEGAISDAIAAAIMAAPLAQQQAVHAEIEWDGLLEEVVIEEKRNAAEERSEQRWNDRHER